jgi:actin-related protein
MLAMISTGNPTSLVVYIGHSVTYTSAVFQNKKIFYPRNRINIGGDNCTQYLQTILTERGYYFETSDEYESIREMKEKLSFVALNYDEDVQEQMFFECRKRIPTS